MDKTTIIEYVLGGSNIYVRFLLLLVGTFVYTIFLRRKLKISMFLGAPISFIVASIIPLTLTLPPYLVLWILYQLLKKNGKSLRLGNSDKPIKALEEGFTFRVNNKTVHLENPYRGIYIQGGQEVENRPLWSIQFCNKRFIRVILESAMTLNRPN
ncbi:hypothetical protein [Arenibacter lacus]|uniref:hypothetical protein n=1 Tax=Arenibacter lacus TaxID=2608629 RepID=UPI00123E3215|nr:hypothetical protein [Arenibacter lacus]